MAVFSMCFAGLVLVMLAVAAELLFVQSPEGREVGFGYAFNWSIVYPLLIPFLVFLLLSLIQEVPRVLRRLAAHGMLRDQQGEIVTADRLIEEWDKLLRGSVRVWMICGLGLGLLFSIVEWIFSCLIPLVKRDVGEAAADWSIAAVWTAPEGAYYFPALVNASFSFICFIFQALSIAVIVGFVLFMVYLARLLRPTDDTLPSIVPDLTLSDERLGFQLFEPIMRDVIGATLIAYLMAYLSRLQKLYLSSEGFTSIIDFVKDDIILGFQNGPMGFLETDLFGENATTGPGTMIVIIATFAVFGFVVFLVARTLLHTAEEARSRISRLPGFPNSEAQRLNKSPESVSQQVANMKVWPLRYPSFNILLSFVFVAIVCLVFYRLGLVAFGLSIFALLMRVFRKHDSTITLAHSQPAP